MRPQAAARPAGIRPRAPNRRFGFLAGSITWLAIILMVVPGNLDYSLDVNNTAVYQPNPVTRTLWLLMLFGSFVVMAVRFGTLMRLVRRLNACFLLFPMLVLASIAWSIDPDLTMTRAVRLLILDSIVIAFALAAWHARRLQHVVRPVLTIMLLGSILFGLLSPENAIHQETLPELLGAWHGLAQGKNSLGAMASFGFIFSFHAWLSREVRATRALVGMIAAASCLVLSRSSTSTMATVLCALFLLLLLKVPKSARRYVPYLVTGFATLILTYSIAMLHLVPGSDLLLAPIPLITGKDLTFTGRAEIWAIAIDHISLRPWLGSGYGAYWAGAVPTSESYVMLQKLRGFYPGSCHNGYLDILNDLGVVGLFCLGGYLVIYLRDSIRLFFIDRTQSALFLALFLQQALSNLTESHWLNVTSFDFLLMSLATAALGRALAESGGVRRQVGPVLNRSGQFAA